ncbi:hypothetical protein B0T42_03210 [Rathayibacter sp. VKM Ac-2630]|nr:hypothetical protein B0T42_03210 [Rathayibacter sp. VKM Ac-2630]
MAVHAHPDDETLTMGGTLARLVAQGAAVTVVTATRGECGEVIPEDLAALEGADELASHRTTELVVALTALGVADHRFLGAENARARGAAPRVYRDSGMQWGPGRVPVPLEPVHPAAFTAAPEEEEIADLVAVLQQTRAASCSRTTRGAGTATPTTCARRASPAGRPSCSGSASSRSCPRTRRPRTATSSSSWATRTTPASAPPWRPTPPRSSSRGSRPGSPAARRSPSGASSGSVRPPRSQRRRTRSSPTTGPTSAPASSRAPSRCSSAPSSERSPRSPTRRPSSSATPSCRWACWRRSPPCSSCSWGSAS